VKWIGIFCHLLVKETKMKSRTDNLATEFLLGKLSEAESIKLEKGYFGSSKVFEEIIFAETELIDAYVTGKLSSEDRKRFENRLLLNPRQRQKVEFARTLNKYAAALPFSIEVSNDDPVEFSWTAFISHFLTHKSELVFTSTVAVLIFFAGIWMIFKQPNPRLERTDELTIIQTPEPVQNQNPSRIENNGDPKEKPIAETTPRPAPKPAESKLPPAGKPEPKKIVTPTIFSLILSPGLTRDAGTGQRFNLPAGTDLVRTQLKFEPGSFSVYHATLETVEGHQVWSSRTLKVRKAAQSLTISIPAKLLKTADYILTLKGINPEGFYENVESYSFTILKARSND